MSVKKFDNISNDLHFASGSFHDNLTKGVKLIAQKIAKKIYVVQLVEYFNHANL